MYVPIKNWYRRETSMLGGYKIVYVPEHPKNFGGFYYEHRLVIEKTVGRILNSWETVHHISNNKLDNRLDNLFVCSRSEHDRAC